MCVCVCVLYGTWRPISLAQRRGFFFLLVSACDFRREKENVKRHARTTNRRTLVSLESPDHERPPSRFLALGAGSFGMATGRGTGHLLSATPLDSNRVETTRPRLPVKPTCILVSTGLVESSFPSPRNGGPYSIKFA